jgi:acetylornithine deacetylase
VAAHGSLPEAGIDAIVKMGKVLSGIESMGARLSNSERHPLLGPGSMHASLISGGQELSSYPAGCRLSLERRTLPGEHIQAIEAELREMLEQIGAADPDFKASIRTVMFRGPLEVPRNEPVVLALAKNVAAKTGKRPEYKGMGGWMDSAILAEVGIPSVIFGPAGEGLHGVNEWVDLESVRLCQEIVLATVRDFCD